MTSPAPPAHQLAVTSCFSCRRSKRRCDKTLPACRLCRQKGWKCSYPQRRGQPSPERPQAVGAGPVLASVAAAPDSFFLTSAFKFLRPALFREAGLQIPRLSLDIPDDVARQLGDSQQMRDTTAKFFRLTASWMPIINRKRHLTALLNPLSPDRRQTALAALCMKLSCSSLAHDDGAQATLLYRRAKSFYSDVEATQDLSVQVLQAAVCIALFEIGHAIYPAAYFTVGACARYGIAMGLDKVNKKRTPGPGPAAASWMDIEEARRVWWAVLVLDRLIDFANPSQSLATEDPCFEDFLPVDDDCFHDATAHPSDAVPISEAFTLKIGQFSRLCQATYLVSKVLAAIKFASTHPRDPSEVHLPPDMKQLCRTLEALVRANEAEITIRKLAFCSQSLVSYSGVFLLQHHCWNQFEVRSTQEAERHTFGETRSAFDTLCRIASYLKQGYDEQYLLGGECTFFLAHVVYQAISALMTIRQSKSSAEVHGRITTLGWLLQYLKPRWPLAGVYASILETKEVVLTAEAI